MAAPVLLLAACLAVPARSDHVVAGDLAAASAAFAAVDPDAVVGWAPAPGMARIFPVAELRRLAARLGSPVAPDADVCVERKVAPPDPVRIRAAMQSQFPQAEVELEDYSHAPIPAGDLVFPKNGLRRAGGALYWNGYVEYAGGRKFVIWAKVRAHAVKTAVVAATDLAPGRAIEAAQLRIETRDDFLNTGWAGSLEEAVGKWPRRPIRAGAVVATSWLTSPPEVASGDPVKVEVSSGGVHLELEARAESSAPRGGRVAVVDPVTQRRFFARVEGKGLVSASAPEAPARGNP